MSTVGTPANAKHLAAPLVFEERQGFLIVTFKAPLVVDTGSKPEGSGTTQNTTQKIIALIGLNPEVLRQKLAEATGITADGVKYHLKQM